MVKCTKISLAWGCKCEKELGHKGLCVSEGDGFWGTCVKCNKQKECTCGKADN